MRLEFGCDRARSRGSAAGGHGAPYSLSDIVGERSRARRLIIRASSHESKIELRLGDEVLLGCRLQAIDDVVVRLRETAGLVLAVEQLSIAPDVENAAGAFDEHSLHTDLVFDQCRQTGGFGVVVSNTAIRDGDFHTFSSSRVDATPTTKVFRLSARRRGCPSIIVRPPAGSTGLARSGIRRFAGGRNIATPPPVPRSWKQNRKPEWNQNGNTDARVASDS